MERSAMAREDHSGKHVEPANVEPANVEPANIEPANIEPANVEGEDKGEGEPNVGKELANKKARVS